MECLIFNIVVFDFQVDGFEWLVLVFVYGGVFVMGSSFYLQYDFVCIVQRSVKIGKLIIVVGVK